jgi:hypothetical protein
MAPKPQLIDWREIILQGVETQELDYKAAQHWLKLPRAGKAKFVRHALALANTKGGYIVIGVGEDQNGNPTDLQGLTDEQLKSFDPSIVAQFINLYADPAIDIDVIRPEIDGKYYAILVVRPFTNLPHVCADHCAQELQQGVFYIRTPDARSRPAHRASELQQLVQRALRNQREVLGRMLRGVLYEGRQFADSDAEQEFLREYQRSERECCQWIGPKTLNQVCTLDIAAYPTTYQPDDRMLSDISAALHRVTLPAPSDLPFLSHVSDDELFFTNDSLLGQRKNDPLTRFDRMQLFQSGLLHYAINLTTPENANELPYFHLARRIATALQLISEYYSELGLDDELLTITILLKGTLNCQLTGTDHPNEAHFTCRIPDIEIKKRRTVADLAADTLPPTEKIIQEICERFNYEARHHQNLRPFLKRL